MEEKKQNWAVCYGERNQGNKKWCVIAAESARAAVEILKLYYPGYEIFGCYKQMQKWAWS